MKKKLMIIGFTILFMLVNVITAYAATETTVTLQADKTEVKAGETFTVTLSATCPDGINGVVTTYSYDEEKLEYVSEAVADSNYSFGGNKDEKEIFVYCTSTDSIQEADIYTLTFKVKDDVEAGNTATVSITETTLDSDAATDSEHTLSAQEVTITVAETGGSSGGGTGDEECEHTTYETKHDDTHHWEACSECGEIKEGSTESHTYETYTDNEDGTHSSNCTVCGYELEEDHNFVDGECTLCGAEETEDEECDHTYEKYTDNGDGTHTATCTKCGNKLTEKHETDETCEKCGYTPTATGNGSSNNGSSNNNNGNTDTATKDYPKAGLSTVVVIGILAILIIAVVMYRKNQKYQDIK